MNSLLSTSAKDLEDSKKDLHTRISDHRWPVDEYAMKSWVFLKENKKLLLLPVVITLITALLLSLVVSNSSETVNNAYSDFDGVLLPK